MHFKACVRIHHASSEESRHVAEALYAMLAKHFVASASCCADDKFYWLVLLGKLAQAVDNAKSW